MRGRFEIRETTSYLHTPEGLHEVTITDVVANCQAKGLATTYEEAVQLAWKQLKAIKAKLPVPEYRYS
jgi:hypothetical protein